MSFFFGALTILPSTRPPTGMKTALPLLLSVLLAPGCILVADDDEEIGGSSVDDDASDVDDDGDPAPEPDELLRECRGDADVGDATQIVGDFDLSIHEMVACGGLSVTLCSSIVYGIAEAIIDNRSDATPDGWAFEGDGVYTSNAAGAGMTTRFYLAEDYAFGSAGDPLNENLFLSTTYLRGARVEIDFDPSDPLSTSASLHFEEPGPYVELLGFGPDPQSPIPVGSNTWAQVEAQLGTLEFESVVAVDDPQNQTTVRYEVTTPRMPAAALLSGGAMPYDLERADASRGDLEQDLIVDDWGVEFVNGNIGALQGTVEFHVEGGPFRYLGALNYDDATYADIDLECP